MNHLRNAALRYLCLLGCALSFVSSPSLYAANKLLSFEEDGDNQMVMPDGCNNPFRETIKFVNFFETTIVTMAAERGAKAHGVVDLFAVDRLRDILNDESNRKGGEESAVDRLIVTQVCHYEKVATQMNLTKGAKALQITAKDPGLHDHLVGISKKLLADTVELYRAEKKSQKEAKDQEKFVLSRKQEVRKAKDLGDEKVRSLIR